MAATCRHPDDGPGPARRSGGRTRPRQRKADLPDHPREPGRGPAAVPSGRGGSFEEDRDFRAGRDRLAGARSPRRGRQPDPVVRSSRGLAPGAGRHRPRRAAVPGRPARRRCDLRPEGPRLGQALARDDADLHERRLRGPRRRRPAVARLERLLAQRLRRGHRGQHRADAGHRRSVRCDRPGGVSTGWQRERRGRHDAARAHRDPPEHPERWRPGPAFSFLGPAHRQGHGDARGRGG